jgi:conjugal transfer pilus assembly protein TraF
MIKGVFMGIMAGIVSQALGQASSQKGSWYDRHQQGWHWYKKRPQRLKPKKRVDQSQGEPAHRTEDQPSNAPVPETYSQRLKEFQEKLEEFQARAVLNPTVGNVVDYKKLHDAVIDQANKFQDAWMYVSLLTTSPQEANFLTPKGREMRDNKEKEDLERSIQNLARDHGLFFVFKQECPYCHEFSPLVKEFSKKYGFEIKAISADGGTLPEFPDAEQDNGIVSLINPEGIYPALYLVNPGANSVFPLSWGMVNEGGLKENIKHYLVLADKEFPR